jgi:hypothetical protein
LSIIISPESELAKELARWNKPYDIHDPANRFPMMLYMARRRPDGVVSVCEVEDFPGRPGSAESFNSSCQMIVRSEQERVDALGRGWRETLDEAKARFEIKEQSIAQVAAQRAHEDRNMGELAKAEAKEADAATAEHVPEVPEKPRQRRKHTHRTVAA